MIGLYILTSTALKNDNKAFKFGMSMRLHERWYDYSDTFSDPRYYCIFEISTELTDKQVKFLEGQILEKTKEFRKITLGNEYRDTSQISYEDFIKIAEKILRKYNVDYILEYERIFYKPERKYNENTGDIEEESFEPLPQMMEPEPELEIIKLQNEVQIYSNIVFNKYLSENKYFQGLYYIATGIGKTYIAYKNCLDHLKRYPDHNILWITYKNEIVNSQNTTLLGDVIVKCNEGNLDTNIINRLRGKIIIVLRQGLVHKYKSINKDIINGIIYDECQDASKVSIKKETLINSEIITKTKGITYDILKYFENDNLKYRIGYSATPLTDDIRQNAGILELYGNNGKINYLHKFSLIDGAKDKIILKPNIEYIPINGIYSLFKDFRPDENMEIITKIFDFIKSVIQKDILIYKKLILWFPSIEISEYFYKYFETDLTKYISNSRSEYSSNKHDTQFRKSTNNCLMFACDKFTTGFDSKNLEAGINFVLNEQGHLIVQKLGRFTRIKDIQNTAYLYQIIDYKENNDSLVDNLVKCTLGLGIPLENINRYIKYKEHNTRNLLSHNVMQIFNLEEHKLNLDILDNKIKFKLSNDTPNIKIRNLIRKYNETSHISNSIISINDVKDFLKNHRWFNYYNDLELSSNNFKFCFSPSKLEEIQNALYKEEEFINTCDIHNITQDNYQEHDDIKLPPWKFIEEGYYNGKVFNTIIESSDFDGY